MAFVGVRPTVRRRIGRLATYGIFVILVAVIAFTADWPAIHTYFFNLDVAKKLWPLILWAGVNTIWYTAFAFVVGLLLAVVLALLKMSNGPFKWFAIAYIEFFRGLPALLTIILMVFAIPIVFKIKFPGGPVGGGLAALIIVTSAYTAEIIRAGIVAVPVGQHEAARSLGMGSLRTTLTVIMPQAFRIVIPPLTNEFVTLLKDTSLLFAAGLMLYQRVGIPTQMELTSFGRSSQTTYGSPTPLIAAAICYLIITLPLTYLISRLEKSMAVKK